MKRLFLAFAACAVPLIAGCAVEGPFPSLAQRGVERERPTEPVRPSPDVAADAALQTRVAELLALARQGDRDFDAAFGRAEAVARGAGAPDSDSWIAAQQQISRVEAARAETMRALGDLDQLALQRADVPTSEADYTAVNSAIQTVERLALEQQSRLDRLKDIIAR
jgi:hypothetical protein